MRNKERCDNFLRTTSCEIRHSNTLCMQAQREGIVVDDRANRKGKFIFIPRCFLDSTHLSLLSKAISSNKYIYCILPFSSIGGGKVAIGIIQQYNLLINSKN